LSKPYLLHPTTFPMSTHTFEKHLGSPKQEKKTAVVVQWSAHSTWYPKLLSALPKNLIYSLSRVERSLVRIQLTVYMVPFAWFIWCSLFDEP
jgi:hypothetical protein